MVELESIARALKMSLVFAISRCVSGERYMEDDDSIAFWGSGVYLSPVRSLSEYRSVRDVGGRLKVEL